MVKITIGFFLSILSAVLILTKPVYADEIVLSTRDLRKNVFASKISVCSEIVGIDGEAISSFYSRQFNGWNAPQIGAPVDETAYMAGENILFIASDGHVGPQLRECLAKHALVSDDLVGYVENHAERLGKGIGELEGFKLPNYYGPVLAAWSYRKIENWLIMSFVSSEGDAYRINHALTNLFGLNVKVCETSTACAQ